MSAELVLGPDGRARSARYDDVYQPDVDGGQARAVFLAGNGLPERLAIHAGTFTVLELGFGTGLNFVETWRAWRAVGAPCALAYVGLDLHPLTRAEARAAAEARARTRGDGELEWDVAALLAAWPEVWPEVWPQSWAEGDREHGPSARALELALEDRAGGSAIGGAADEWGAADAPDAPDAPDARDTPGARLHLTLLRDTFERAVPALAAAAPGSVDAVYLDGFSPAKNPSAWTETVLDAVGRAVRTGGTAATWCVAGAVRRGLAAAGFDVHRLPGYGRKRERLAAVRRGAP